VTTNHLCSRPPAGWRCTRDPGHDGPCAALPVVGWPVDVATGGNPEARLGWHPAEPRWCSARWSEITVKVFEAAWDMHGKAAGAIRNQRMLDEGKPDEVWAFTDDLATSKGTADMVRRARKADVPVYVVSRAK
jgi:hypothetical protein